MTCVQSTDIKCGLIPGVHCGIVRHVNDRKLAEILTNCPEQRQLKINLVDLHVFEMRDAAHAAGRRVALCPQLVKQFVNLMTIRPKLPCKKLCLHRFADTRPQFESKKLRAKEVANALNAQTSFKILKNERFVVLIQLVNSSQMHQARRRWWWSR